MINYFLRRVFFSFTTIFLVSICVFILIHAVPGDPIQNFTKQPRMTEDQIERLRDKYGLNKPLSIQYFHWVFHTVQGDLGYSLFTKRPVIDEIRDRLKNTILLMVPTISSVIILAIVFGSISAMRKDSFIDRFMTTVSLISYSTPSFLLSIIFIAIFYGFLKNPISEKPLFPSGGMYNIVGERTFLDFLHHLILPVTALSLPWIAWYSRFIRSNILKIKNEPFVIAARGRGLPEYLILYKHIMKNALLPLITLIGLDLPLLFGGALGVEIVFYWPGMGRLFWDAAMKRDYPIILGVTIIMSILVIVFNFLADLAHIYLDPRLSIESK